MNTAIAMSKSIMDEQMVNKKRSKELQKIPFNLMLTPKEVQRRLEMRLNKIVTFLETAPGYYGNNRTEKWDKAALCSDISPNDMSYDNINLTDQLEFYVTALMPPIELSTVRIGDRIFSMSLIPGRESSQIYKDCIDNVEKDNESVSVQKDTVVEDDTFIDKNSDENISIVDGVKATDNGRFMSMFNNHYLSDMFILLKSGNILYAHKFVFAAWDCNKEVLTEKEWFISDIDDKVVVSLFRYLYSDGKEDLVNVENSLDYKRLCEMFGLNYERLKVDVVNIPLESSNKSLLSTNVDELAVNVRSSFEYLSPSNNAPSPIHFCQLPLEQIDRMSQCDPEGVNQNDRDSGVMTEYCNLPICQSQSSEITLAPTVYHSTPLELKTKDFNSDPCRNDVEPLDNLNHISDKNDDAELFLQQDGGTSSPYEQNETPNTENGNSKNISYEIGETDKLDGSLMVRRQNVVTLSDNNNKLLNTSIFKNKECESEESDLFQSVSDSFLNDTTFHQLNFTNNDNDYSECRVIDLTNSLPCTNLPISGRQTSPHKQRIVDNNGAPPPGNQECLNYMSDHFNNNNDNDDVHSDHSVVDLTYSPPSQNLIVSRIWSPPPDTFKPLDSYAEHFDSLETSPQNHSNGVNSSICESNYQQINDKQTLNVNNSSVSNNVASISDHEQNIENVVDQIVIDLVDDLHTSNMRQSPPDPFQPRASSPFECGFSNFHDCIPKVDHLSNFTNTNKVASSCQLEQSHLFSSQTTKISMDYQHLVEDNSEAGKSVSDKLLLDTSASFEILPLSKRLGLSDDYFTQHLRKNLPETTGKYKNSNLEKTAKSQKKSSKRSSIEVKPLNEVRSKRKKSDHLVNEVENFGNATNNGIKTKTNERSDSSSKNETKANKPKNPLNPKRKRSKKVERPTGDDSLITPKKQHNIPNAECPFTPMANYRAMETPKIKKLCADMGLKPKLNKNHMIKILEETHEYTHQVAIDSDSTLSSSESDYGNQTVIEIPDAIEVVPPEQNGNVISWSQINYSAILNFLKIHFLRDILTYKPLNISNIHTGLKNEGIDIGWGDLKKFLDNQGIIYETEKKEQLFGFRNIPQPTKYVI